MARAKIEKLLVQPYEIEVHYKKMKNIYLKIKPDGNIMISAPIGTSQSYLIEFVKRKEEWIEARLQKMAQRQQSAIALGKDEILLFGKPVKGSLSDEEFSELLHKKIMSYYHKYWHFFQTQGCSPVEIKYRKMKSTWGVCRPTLCTITFNKRLVHQPAEFIEYVVLHELCHLLIPRHNRDFYDLLAFHMPKYKQYERARIIYEL